MTETDHYTAGVAALVHASTAALRFYDNLDRLHDKGEPDVLDALQRAVDEVRALSPAPAQGCAPAVKKLEWEDGYAFVKPWSAVYRVTFNGGPRKWGLHSQGMPDGPNRYYPTEDAAKAAAQADYEARILSALETEPPAPLRGEGGE